MSYIWAYFLWHHPEVRITFDRNIRSRWQDVSLRQDDSTQLLYTGIENYRLMEIKTDNAIPLVLVAALSELGLRPVSFSKYGNIYKQQMTTDKGVMISHE